MKVNMPNIKQKKINPEENKLYLLLNVGFSWKDKVMYRCLSSPVTCCNSSFCSFPLLPPSPPPALPCPPSSSPLVFPAGVGGRTSWTTAGSNGTWRREIWKWSAGEEEQACIYVGSLWTFWNMRSDLRQREEESESPGLELCGAWNAVLYEKHRGAIEKWIFCCCCRAGLCWFTAWDTTKVMTRSRASSGIWSHPPRKARTRRCSTTPVSISPSSYTAASGRGPPILLL